MKVNFLLILFIVVLVIILICSIYNKFYKNKSIYINKSIHPIISLNNDIYSPSNIDSNLNNIDIVNHNNKLNHINNKMIDLTGLCTVNTYIQSTLSNDLKFKLKNVIQSIIHKYTTMDDSLYKIHNIKYVNEKIDKFNNKRYMVILFINYNELFINDKIYIDFIEYNNGTIHLNKLNNNINSYNTLMNNIKPIDNIIDNNIGLIDQYNINNGVKLIDTRNTQIYKNTNNTMDDYYEEHNKYSNSNFCNKYYHNKWDTFGIKLPKCRSNNNCLLDNKSYQDKIYYPKNNQFIFQKKEENDKYTWLMGSNNIYSDYTSQGVGTPVL